MEHSDPAPGRVEWNGPTLIPGGAQDSQPLWEGAAGVETSCGSTSGTATLRWSWAPQPRLLVEVTTSEPWPLPEDAHIPQGLVLGKTRTAAPTLISLSASQGDTSRLFCLPEVTVGAPDTHVDVVRFALVNFPRYLGQRVGDARLYGRLDLTFGQFRIVLDSVSGRNLREEMEPPHYGYANTQTGLVMSRSGGRLTLSEVRKPLKALWYLLSLMRGAYTSPVCWLGERDGEIQWAHSVGWHLDPWIKDEHGPFPMGFLAFDADSVIPALERSLIRVQDLLDDPDWREILLTALQWYVTSHTGRSTSDIVLAQAGLELLAYAHQVVAGRLSPAGFDRLPAADAITLLLSDLGVDPAIPDRLEALYAYGKRRSLNGPTCVTQYRNATIHPPVKRPHASESDGEVLIEVRALAIFYLEQALLRTFGYDAMVQHRLYGWGHGPGTTTGR